ncbi:MAG: hypothetical protein NT166_03900 [Candidatus Aminicenantes bacterium]|nr:hypothetical protein [Candidatus Aminicenantes bacterium]
MKKFDTSSWPILIISGQVNEKNDEGFRLRELIEQLTKEQDCRVIISLTYHDGNEIFLSRTDLGAVVVDWDMPERFAKVMAEKLSCVALIHEMRKRNKTIPILLLTDRLATEKIPVEVLADINGYLWKTAEPPDFLAGRIAVQVSQYADGVLPVFFGELVKYANEYKYAWHTPGHMGGEGFLRSPAGVALYKFFGENVFRADLSISVPELGSLLDHSGVTGEAEKFSAKVFGADYTYYILNGTSTANQVIWRSQVSRGDIAFVDRNCHKSLNYAMVITEAKPHYMHPRRNGLGIIGPVRLDEFGDKWILEKISERQTSSGRGADTSATKAKMSALTNSTYDGVCYNVKRIKERLEKRVENIHFDEAWYAYAKFHPVYKNHFGMEDVPREPHHPPVFCSQSTHKLLTAFSQASMIHIKNGGSVKIDPVEFNESYMMHSSTSPQYNMVASLDVATKMMHDNGEMIWNDIIVEAVQLRKKMASIKKELKKKKDWFFGMWQPEKVRFKGKMVHLEDAPTEALARDQGAWTLTADNNWHGFEDMEDDYAMLDPVKLTFTCPGLDDKGNISKEGIPAAVVTDYLITRGIVAEKTDYYSWLMLNSLGTTKGKQGTLLAGLFRFKQLYDANTPLAEVFPDLAARYPGKYKSLGLKDHCREMHRFLSDHKMLKKLDAAFSLIPRQVMTPAEAYHHVVKKKVEYMDIGKMTGHVTAVMLTPYPPGIPIMMGGELMEKLPGKDINPICEYLLLRQEFENEFPGYESDIHGIERVERNGKTYFRTLCIKKRSIG